MMFMKKTIIAVGFILLFSYPFFYAKAQEKQESVLSKNTEQAWVFYVQRRLVEQIIRDGQNLKVLNSAYIGIEPSYVYVSVNHPYRIMCNDEAQMGLSVAFGAGEESDIMVNLTGIFSPEYKNEPKLDIAPNSIEAKKLDATLCKLAADWMKRQEASGINSHDISHRVTN